MIETVSVCVHPGRFMMRSIPVIYIQYFKHETKHEHSHDKRAQHIGIGKKTHFKVRVCSTLASVHSEHLMLLQQKSHVGTRDTRVIWAVGERLGECNRCENNVDNLD